MFAAWRQICAASTIARALVSVVLFALPPITYGQEMRLFGLDDHVSIAGACASLLAEHSRNLAILKTYEIGGPKCRNKSYTALFMTLKVSTDTYAGVGEFALLKLMFEKTYALTSIQQQRDRYVDGVRLEIELLGLTDRHNRHKAVAWVSADNSQRGAVYLTVLLFRPNPAALALDRKRTLAEMRELLGSIWVSGGSKR
jgi:hypothetical protein